MQSFIDDDIHLFSQQIKKITQCTHDRPENFLF